MTDGYPLRPLGEVIRLDIQRTPMMPATTYRLAGVLNAGQGLVAKGELDGGDTEYASMNVLRVDQVVMRKLTAWEGPITVVPAEFDGFVVSSEFPTFTLGPELVPDWMRHVCRSPRLWAEMKNRVSGTVQRRKRLNPEHLLQIKLPIPPREVQAGIVEILDAVDDQITALEAEVEAVVKVRTGLVGRSADTGQVPLGSLGVVSQGKGLPKEFQGKRTGEVSWYKIADMTGPGNEFGYTVADTRLTPSEVAEIGGVVVEAGAVTFPRVGAAVLTEKKRIVDTPGALDENHLVITPGKGTNSEYLLAVMESFALSSLVRPGAVPSLNMGLIRSTKVPWSWRENQSLGTALGALRAESRVLAAEAARLREVRAALLAGMLDRSIDIESAELEG
ncbi:restriction endonuclease subunit S [Microbispora triticiradicis]|uniref:restriction endonuclease subunit S n=1 Tax=Microbispora TaxID=2005 RepID=UPI001ABF4CA2|nr:MULTISPECIES: restriction endonuclease subunit S [Microbispora]